MLWLILMSFQSLCLVDGSRQCNQSLQQSTADHTLVHMHHQFCAEWYLTTKATWMVPNWRVQKTNPKLGRLSRCLPPPNLPLWRLLSRLQVLQVCHFSKELVEYHTTFTKPEQKRWRTFPHFQRRHGRRRCGGWPMGTENILICFRLSS